MTWVKENDVKQKTNDKSKHICTHPKTRRRRERALAQRRTQLAQWELQGNDRKIKIAKQDIKNLERKLP